MGMNIHECVVDDILDENVCWVTPQEETEYYALRCYKTVEYMRAGIRAKVYYSGYKNVSGDRPPKETESKFGLILFGEAIDQMDEILKNHGFGNLDWYDVTDSIYIKVVGGSCKKRDMPVPGEVFEMNKEEYTKEFDEQQRKDREKYDSMKSLWKQVSENDKQ